MKKIIILLLCASASIMSYAQIAGPLTITTIGTPQIYSVPAATAQCTSCYSWSVSGGFLGISGVNTNSSVTIIGTGTGIGTLTLTYFTNGVCQTLTKTIGVGNAICNFNPTAIGYNFDVMGTGIANFYVTPVSVPSGAITYAWTFTYKYPTTATTPAGGLTSSTAEKPSFVIDCNNPMISAKVVITKTGCTPNTITLTKGWSAKFGGICVFAPIRPNGNNEDTQMTNSDKGTIENITVSQNPTSSTIKPVESLNMTVFPNPIDNDLTVVFDKQVSDTEGVSSQLELYNLQGQLLKQQPLETGLDETKVSMQQLPAGVYMISLRQNGQIISSVKVTKN